MARCLLFLALFLCPGSLSWAGWQMQTHRALGELPGGAEVWKAEMTSGSGQVNVTGVSFPASRYELRVIDNPPEKRHSLSAAAERIGAVAGVNGGYFHPDERPLGLVVSGGITLHGYERAKLLSGLVVLRKGKWDLLRASAFKSSDGLEAALQAGPWLVENGIPVAGLNAERRARRTLVGHDGRGNWVLAATGPITLAAAADLLAQAELPTGIRLRQALNLDGGSSTAFWASTSPQATQIPCFGEVRNYLAIVPRQK